MPDPEEPTEVKCHCYGESVSLKIKSDPNDSVLATRQFSIY